MTFEQYYIEIAKRIGEINVSREYVRILWGYGYTVEQAVNSITTDD